MNQIALSYKSIQYLIFSLVILAVLITGCSEPNKDLTLSVFITGSDSERAGQALKKALEEEGWNLTLVNQTHQEAVESIRAGKVDLAILSNDISIDSKGVRTLLPLYNEVLVTLVKEGSPLAKVEDFGEVVEIITSQRPTVLFSYENSYDHLFAKRMLSKEGITDDTYNAIFLPKVDDFENGIMDFIAQEKPDVIYTMATLDSKVISAVMELGYLFRNAETQVDNIDIAYVSSLASKMPRSFPLIVPARTFSRNQAEPVATLGLYTSLICGKHFDDESAYDLIRDVMYSLPELIKFNQNFFVITSDFDRRLLNFQMHPGAKNYFERHKPSFWERYAELGGVIFSMTVVLLGLLVTLNKIVTQRKKDRIDVYFLEVMEARKNSNYQEGLNKLTQLEEKALNQMVEEKLAADSSYIVFLQMLSQAREELKTKLEDV